MKVSGQAERNRIIHLLLLTIYVLFHAITAEKTNDPNRNKDIIHLHEVQRDLNQLREFQYDAYQDADCDADSESSEVDDIDIKSNCTM